MSPVIRDERSGDVDVISDVVLAAFSSLPDYKPVEHLIVAALRQARALAVSLVVSVTNDGAAGNADDWTLAVYAPGRFNLRGLQPVHVNGVVAMPGSSGKRVDLDREDLSVKSKDNPITKGKTLTGVLTFILAKTAASDISNNNTSLVLHFKDSQGNSYQTGKATVGGKR